LEVGENGRVSLPRLCKVPQIVLGKLVVQLVSVKKQPAFPKRQVSDILVTEVVINGIPMPISDEC
jgi:hypothetical protein